MCSPPRPRPSPTQVLHAVDATTQLPLTEFFLGCIYSNDPLDRSVPPPTHGHAHSASLPQPSDIATINSPSSTSRTSDRPPGLEGQAPLSSPHGILVKAAPVRPRSQTPTPVPSLQPHATTTQVGTHPVRTSPTCKRRASTALAGTHHAIGADPRKGTGPFPKPRALVLPMLKFGQSNPGGLGHIDIVDSDLMHHQYRLSVLQWNSGQRAGTPPMSSQRLVDGFMRFYFKMPEITFLTPPISSLRTLATRTSPSCSIKTPSSPTLWFSLSRKTPQAKVCGVWFHSSFEAFCVTLLFRVLRRSHFALFTSTMSWPRNVTLPLIFYGGFMGT